MLILLGLLLLKLILFTSLTQVEHGRLFVVLFSFLISSLVIFLLDILVRDQARKKRLIIGFYGLISLIMLVDSMHFSYFSSLPSVKMLGQAGQLGDVLDSLYSLINIRSLGLVLDLPILIYIYRKKDFAFSLRYLIREVGYGILALNFLGIILVLYGAGPDMRASLREQELYSFHFEDIRSAIFDRDSLDEEADRESREELLGEILERSKPKKEARLRGLAKGKNLIVIQVEALQNFVIGMDYEGQEITPNLNKLAKNKSTIYYDNYFQLTGRGNTSDAEFVSNNSLHPSMEASSYEQYGDNSFYGLPWILREEGYSSWVFHGYDRNFWSRDKAYPKQGFENFIAEDDYDYSKKDKIGLGISDREFFRQSLDYMADIEEPFYAFLISLTSHNPYKMPKKYQKLELLPEHEGSLFGDYLQAIHYTDSCLGDFIEGLKEEGLYENSLIALYGDHFAIQPGDEKSRKIMSQYLGVEYESDHVMNIPLMIHLPGEDIHEVNSKVGSQIDFMPTILNIMGYDRQKSLMFGVDLNNFEGENLVKPQTILRKGSFIGEDFVFEIARTQIFDQSRAYDRHTREELDIGSFRQTYERVLDEINLSDFILKNDLIADILEGEIDLDSLDVRAERFPTIYNREFSQLKELEKLFKNSPKALVARGTMDDEGRIYMNNILFEDILSWEKEDKTRKDLVYCLSLDRDIMDDYLKRLKFLDSDSRQRHIFIFDDFDDYFKITNYGFQNSILDLRKTSYSPEELRDFLRTGDLYGVILASRDRDYIDILKREGIPYYLEEEVGWVLYE